MIYLIAVVAVLGGIIVGWLMRHSILTRQLKQSRKQMEEIKTLQMNLEHDVARARKKLMAQSQTQKKGKTTTEPKTDQEKQKPDQFVEKLTRQLDELKSENEDLHGQIGYLDAEKNSWLEYRSMAQDEIKRLLKEIQSLKEQIDSLKNKAEISAKSSRVEKTKADMERAEKQPSGTSKTLVENTKKISMRKETDRVELVERPEIVDQAADEKNKATTPEHQLVENQTSEKKASPKKKPKTTRIDRSTNEIIDNFKRDLGLPDY